jgi:glycosyltransferase involved in cell wall biosynthesis
VRIALVMNLAPRKLGSLEDWVVALCREAAWAGHQVDAYGREPVHPVFVERLAAFGVTWRSAELLERGWSSVKRLATYDVIHLNLYAPRSQVALAAYAAVPARVLFVVHSEFPKHRPSLARRALDRVTLTRVHSLAGVSSYVREQERARFGLSPGRTRTLYNGIDFSRFRPPSDEATRKGTRFITVAYFQPDKGLHHLIRAFADVRAPDATLTLCGDGPETPRLVGLIHALGLGDRVHLAGLRDDLEQQLPAADVFIHGAFREAFGLAIAEAMSCGRAVIASRAGGVPELVEDGVSGVLVSPGDEAGLTAAMQRLADDPALRARLGEKARERVVQRFGLRRSALEHVKWCEEAVEPGARLRTRGRVPVNGGEVRASPFVTPPAPLGPNHAQTEEVAEDLRRATPSHEVPT